MITIDNKNYEVVNEPIIKGDLMLINNPHPHSSLKNVVRLCDGTEKMSNGEEGYYWFNMVNKERRNGYHSPTFPKSMCKKIIEV